MSEGVPKQEVSVVEKEGGIEEVLEWRDLEEKAPAQVEAMIVQVEGYEDMGLEEKKEALSDLMNTLPEASDQEFNNYRYVAKEIAIMMSGLDLDIEMAELTERRESINQ